jgi:hypothetical protein
MSDDLFEAEAYRFRPRRRDGQRMAGKTLGVLGASIIIGIVMWPAVNANVTKPLASFVKYPSLIAFGLYAVFAISAIAVMVRRRRWPTREALRLAFWTLLLWVPAYSLGIYVISAGMLDTLKSIGGLKQYADIETVVGVTFGVASLGSALFWFRFRFRSTYGLTEAIAGVSIAGYKAAEIGNSLQMLVLIPGRDSLDLVMVLLTAGVYLVVRGLDNVYVGLTDPKRPDPIFAAMLGRRGAPHSP